MEQIKNSKLAKAAIAALVAAAAVYTGVLPLDQVAALARSVVASLLPEVLGGIDLGTVLP